MNSIEEELEGKILDVFEQLYQVKLESEVIQVQQTKKEFTGDRTLVVFPLLKWSNNFSRTNS